MAAEQDNGQNTYWFDGQPYQYLESPDDDTGASQIYWFDGEPSEFLQPTSAPPAADTAAMLMMFF